MNRKTTLLLALFGSVAATGLIALRAHAEEVRKVPKQNAPLSGDTKPAPAPASREPPALPPTAIPRDPPAPAPAPAPRDSGAVGKKGPAYHQADQISKDKDGKWKNQ